MRVTSIALSLSVIFFCSNPGLRADDDDRRGEGKTIFSAQLLRISDLNVPTGNPAGQQLGPLFSPNGTDPLDEGSVEVRDEGRVEVRVRRASPSVKYTVFFCRFAFGPAGCVMVGAAESLSTDAGGDGRASLQFTPSTTGPTSWAGVFILTRIISAQATNEFVSGFRLRPPMTPPEGAEIEIDGFISSINAALKSFRVGNLPQDIFTDNATEFRGGARAFSDLVVGRRVEVKGRVAGDGKLTAREVELGGEGQEPPRGRKHR